MNSLPTFNQNSKYLLRLFIFLLEKVDNWIPNLIQSYEDKVSPTGPSVANGIIPNVNGEGNRIEGWPLFATIKIYLKISGKIKI